MATRNNVSPLSINNSSPIGDDDDDCCAVSHSPIVPRYEPAVYKYSREEMITMYVDDEYPLPELLPTYKSLFVDRIQQPLSLMNNSEDNISLISTRPTSPSSDRYFHGDENRYFLNSTQGISPLISKSDIYMSNYNNMNNLHRNCSLEREEDHQQQRFVCKPNNYQLNNDNNLNMNNSNDEGNTNAMDKEESNTKSKATVDQVADSAIIADDEEMMLPHTFYTYSLPNSNNSSVDSLKNHDLCKVKDAHQEFENLSNATNNWCQKSNLLIEQPISSQHECSINNLNGSVSGGICDDHNLPEWAIETSLGGGGTFDATGEFHGLIHNDNTMTCKETSRSSTDLPPYFNKNVIKDDFSDNSQHRSSYMVNIPQNLKDSKYYKDKFYTSSKSSEKLTTKFDGLLTPRNGNILNCYNDDFTKNDEYSYQLKNITKDVTEKIVLNSDLNPNAIKVMGNITATQDHSENVLQRKMMGSNIVDSNSRSSSSGSSTLFSEERLRESNEVYQQRQQQQQQQQQLIDTLTEQRLQYQYLPQPLAFSTAYNMWFYRDPQSKVQGPFSSLEMLEWSKAGYFNDALLVRRICDLCFRPLGEMIKLCGGQMPFLHSHMIPTMCPDNNINTPPISMQIMANTTNLISSNYTTNNSRDLVAANQKLQTHHNALMQMLDIKNSHPIIENTCSDVLSSSGKLQNTLRTLEDVRNKSNVTISSVSDNFASTNHINQQMEDNFALEQNKNTLKFYLKQFIEHDICLSQSGNNLSSQHNNSISPQIDRTYNCDNLNNLPFSEETVVDENNLDFLNGMNLRKFLKSTNGANLYDFIMESKALGVSPDVISSYVIKMLKGRVSNNNNGINVNEQSNGLLEQFQSIVRSEIFATEQPSSNEVSDKPEDNIIVNTTLGDKLLNNVNVLPETSIKQSDKIMDRENTVSDDILEQKSVEKVEVSPNATMSKYLQEKTEQNNSEQLASNVTHKEVTNTEENQTQIKNSSNSSHSKSIEQAEIDTTLTQEENSAFKTYNNHVNNVTQKASKSKKETALQPSRILSNQVKAYNNNNNYCDQEFIKVNRHNKYVKNQQCLKDKNNLIYTASKSAKQEITNDDNSVIVQDVDNQKKDVPENNLTNDTNGSNTILNYYNNAKQQRELQLYENAKRSYTSSAPWYFTANTSSGPCLAEIQRAERKQQRAQQRQTKSQQKEDSGKTNLLKTMELGSSPSSSTKMLSGTLKWNTTPIPVKSFDEIQAEEARKLLNLNAKYENNQEQRHTIVTSIGNNNNNTNIWEDNKTFMYSNSVSGFWDNVLNPKKSNTANYVKQNIPETFLNVKINDVVKSNGKRATTICDQQQAQQQHSQTNTKASKNCREENIQQQKPQLQPPAVSLAGTKSQNSSTTQQEVKNKKKDNICGTVENQSSGASPSKKKTDDYEAEFSNWCTKTLNSMNTKLDVPTFIAFLRDLESPYEVKEYIRAYIGGGKQCINFAKEYLERRSIFKSRQRALNAHNDDLCKPAVAITPNGKEYPETKVKQKKVKKNKMTTKLDVNLLGYRTERRANNGNRHL